MQLPAAFIQDMESLFGKEQALLLMRSLEEAASVSIRLNRIKQHALSPDFQRPEPVIPWCETGSYLKEKLNFTFDPLFHAGVYYVQEASSMFLEQVLKQLIHQPVTMLDLCAAPGGKSTLARDVLPEGSLLIANEVMPARAQILTENLQKWGHPDVIVTSNLPAEIGAMGPVFDVILTDVPCSGEGMFRKDPVAIQEWSAENVTLCERRQRDILRDIWPSLKSGGLLIYSTCTYNSRENEENIAWIARELEAEILLVSIQPEWGITGNLTHEAFPVYRFLPHCTRGEGLFMAVLRKAGEGELAPPSPKKHKKGSKNKSKEPKKATIPFSLHKAPYHQLSEWLTEEKENNTEWVFSLSDTGACNAIRREHSGTLRQLQKTGLRILSPGLPLAIRKGKDLIPHPALALSYALNKKAFPQAELTHAQTIAYLRKESIQLASDTPSGYILVTYHSVPLGFVKNIGNRSNNLYPAEWRIRSSHLPQEMQILEQVLPSFRQPGRD